ncbi:hypothetical protein K503DRAFT_800463 [Rhizopogon vinicolor AM-OR11-026]|uniref:Uncharacterized protein n=1 Tax=Rhizopogon vinicolor AM-OR11-026 TaxID=1314800 RepID=A0A1B7N0P4_9AGAM|nr:hypothetical protein K503DRAFT_800463 [Rhizopogon vinicolor AM-OR11-026]
MGLGPRRAKGRVLESEASYPPTLAPNRSTTLPLGHGYPRYQYLNIVEPTAEVCPNFTAEFYDNIRGDIHTTTGQPDSQIIDNLIQSWTEGHNHRVGEWNQQREEEEQAIAEAALARAAQEEGEATKSNSRQRRRNPRWTASVTNSLILALLTFLCIIPATRMPMHYPHGCPRTTHVDAWIATHVDACTFIMWTNFIPCARGRMLSLSLRAWTVLTLHRRVMNYSQCPVTHPAEPAIANFAAVTAEAPVPARLRIKFNSLSFLLYVPHPPRDIWVSEDLRLEAGKRYALSPKTRETPEVLSQSLSDRFFVTSLNSAPIICHVKVNLKD